jgi:hypothetical protein
MSIRFDVAQSPAYAWSAWSNAGYVNISDAGGELVDNCLQSGATQCRIDVTTEEGVRYLTVEDDGKWDKITEDNKSMLTKCFSYGKLASTLKSGLNEHNAGLKQVLAYTDPENANWLIQIRQSGVVWQLEAPYSNSMQLKIVDPALYEGVLNSDNATFIRTIISDRQMKDLYLREPLKGVNEAKLIKRLELYISTLWMMNKKVIDGTFKIFFNKNRIVPYDLNIIDGIEKLADHKTHYKLPLFEGSPDHMNVEIWKYRMTRGYKNKDDHPIFRCNQSSSGVCLFKYGRLVKAKIFEDIYKIACDSHMTGHLVLVNITGESKNLPMTYQTKNNFNHADEKLTVLYDLIRKESYPRNVRPAQENKKTETELLDEFQKQKLQHNEELKDQNMYNIERERYLDLVVDGKPAKSKDRMDMIEWNKAARTVNIIEGKLDSITPENLRQLYFYYRNVKHFCPEFEGYTVKAQFITEKNIDVEGYASELKMIQHAEPDFKPVVKLFSDYGIYCKTD